MLLSRDGMVPVDDRAGHRGALELWRRHCQRVSPSVPAMLAAVGNLLDLPRCDFDRGFAGQQRTTQLAWARPQDILITTHPDFPHHCSVEELAELGSHLIAEQADPDGMAMILGEDYGLSTVAAPHGLLHKVKHNGNHRTAAIKAARFPVALVRTVRYDQPWLLPLRGGRRTRLAYLRLLFRSGLLANFRDVEAEGVADANHWANLLLADTAAEVLSNVAAYEQLYGRCEAWPSWLREPVTLTNLLNRELFTMNGFNLRAFDEVAARWPPPPVAWLKLIVQRLSGTGARLD